MEVKTTVQQIHDAIVPLFRGLPSTASREQAIVLLTQSLAGAGEWHTSDVAEVTQVIGDIVIARESRGIMVANATLYQYS